jgi:hypothetical protein
VVLPSAGATTDTIDFEWSRLETIDVVTGDFLAEHKMDRRLFFLFSSGGLIFMHTLCRSLSCNIVEYETL